MKVTADTSVCVSAGMCVLTAPEVFDQQEGDGLVTVRIHEPLEALRDRVAEAARLCPSGAIRIR